jgi:hypothetical protein
MLPDNVVAVVRPVVLTDTVKLAGVEAVVGAATLSHELPEATDADTLVEEEGDVPIFKVWEAGPEASPSV